MTDFINLVTRLIHLFLLIFFLMVIFNSIWNWAKNTFDNHRP